MEHTSNISSTPSSTLLHTLGDRLFPEYCQHFHFITSYFLCIEYSLPQFSLEPLSYFQSLLHHLLRVSSVLTKLFQITSSFTLLYFFSVFTQHITKKLYIYIIIYFTYCLLTTSPCWNIRSMEGGIICFVHTYIPST